MTQKAVNYIMRSLVAALPKEHIHSRAQNTVIINNIEFARKALEIHDTIATSRLLRLADSLASSSGVLNFALKGGLDAEGMPGLHLSVRGGVLLLCQRCLEPMEFDLEVDVHYRIVSDEGAMSAEDVDQDCLIPDAHMNVAELIEDEALLALPLAPKHPDGGCAAAGMFSQRQKPSPFAALRKLKAGE